MKTGDRQILFGDPQLPESTLGILSVWIALAAFVVALLFVWTFVTTITTGGESAIGAAMMTVFTLLVGVCLSSIGAMLGFLGRRQAQRRHQFARYGFLFNGVLFLVFVTPIVLMLLIGLATGMG